MHSTSGICQFQMNAKMANGIDAGATPKTMLAFTLLTVIWITSLVACMELTSMFYYEQREEDLYLVMEQVTTTDQANVWLAIYDHMEKTRRSEGLHAIIEKYLASRQSDMSETPCRQIGSGAMGAGQSTIKQALTTFGSERPVDLWISYAWSSPEAPTGPIRLTDFLNVELIMTVTTAAPFLYTWHMGITRNYRWNFYPCQGSWRNLCCLAWLCSQNHETSPSRVVLCSFRHDDLDGRHT